MAADPNVELLQGLQRLAGAVEFHEDVPDNPYLRAFDAAFAPYVDDPAVHMARRIRWQHAIGYSAPASLAILLDGDLRLTQPLDPLPAGTDPRWKPRFTERYLERVRAFRETSGFATFWAGQSALVAALEDTHRTRLEQEAVSAWFDASFPHTEAAEVVITPSLTAGDNNFGTYVKRPDGTWLRHPVLGGGVGDAGVVGFSSHYLPIAVHELAHGYAGPFVTTHEDVLREAGLAALEVEGRALRAEAYPDPQIVMDETVTRALTQLFLRDRHPELVDDDLSAMNDAQAFLWIRQVTAVLEAHRAGPESPIDLDAAAAEITEAVRAWAALPEADRLPAFTGPMDNAGPAGVLVAPPGLEPYGQLIVDWFHDNRPALEPELRGTADLPPLDEAEPSRIYGSPTSNPWIAEIARRGEWTFDATGITLGGRHFSGEHLVLLACWPVTTDRTRGHLVYAAADDADLIGVNSLAHGASDWQIARRDETGQHYETVASGSFSTDGPTWTVPPLPAVPEPEAPATGPDTAPEAEPPPG